jgi:hypothetical protein
MLKHFFNSQGRPIAYVHDDCVFLYPNRFLGRMDGDEVWHGVYVGEIVNGNRLLYREAEGREPRPAAKAIFAPGMPIQPWGVSACPAAGRAKMPAPSSARAA